MDQIIGLFGGSSSTDEASTSLASIGLLDQLYQHTSVLTAAFSPLDASRPKWKANPPRFHGINEVDAQSEIAFLVGVQQLCTCLVNLRDNIFDLLLPELEDVLMEAPSEGGLVDTIAQVLLDEVDSAKLQRKVGELLSNAQESRLSQVFLALHLALTNAAALMEEISGRMANCFINAGVWYNVDFVSQVRCLLLITLIAHCAKWSYLIIDVVF